VDGWRARGAGLLTCEDLSTRGWRHRLGDPGSSAAVVSGRVVPVEEITGVLTRRPSILEEELGHITPDDRPYVAAEMNAFLVSWLSSLRCTVLNRPTPLCLSGPNWRPEQWIHAAASIGIAVRPRHRQVPASLDHPTDIPPEDDFVDVTVVGTRCLGTADERLKEGARRLAAAAGVGLLGVRFGLSSSGTYFHAASSWPDTSAPAAVDALRDYFSA